MADLKAEAEPLSEAEVRAVKRGTLVARDVVTHRRVLKIAVPIVISNATVPILGAVDTGVVGQMGAAAPIGAVGLGAIILSALYWIFGFLRMGTVGLTAQAAGNGEEGEVAALLTRGLLIGAGAGLVLMALQWPLFWASFQLAPGSPEVEGLARQYMAIRMALDLAEMGVNEVRASRVKYPADTFSFIQSQYERLRKDKKTVGQFL